MRRRRLVAAAPPPVSMAEPAVVARLPEPDAPATVLPATAPPVTAPPATAPASNKKRKAKGKGLAEPASAAADALQVKINQADFKLVKVMQEKQKLSAKIVHSPENLQGHGVGPSGLAPGLQNDRQSGPEEARTSGWSSMDRHPVGNDATVSRDAVPATKRKGKSPPADKVSGSKKPKTGDAGTMAEPPPNMTPPPVGMSQLHGTKRKRSPSASKCFRPPMAKKVSPVVMRSPMMRLVVSPLVVRPRSPLPSPRRSPPRSPRRSPARSPLSGAIGCR